MKIALCFYGQPRFLEEAYVLSYKKLLDKYSPEVYVHTWWDEKLVGRQYDVAQWARRAIQDEDLVYKSNTVDQIYKLYNPVRIQVDSPINHFLYGQPSNYFQFYTQYAVKELVDRDYDIIIRTRFDFKILQDIPIEQNDSLNVPNTCPDPELLQDAFSFSNQTNFNKISNMYLNLEEFIGKGVGEREYAFKAQVEKEKIPYRLFEASHPTFDVFRSGDKNLVSYDL